jgi:hypothetical protein
MCDTEPRGHLPPQTLPDLSHIINLSLSLSLSQKIKIKIKIKIYYDMTNLLVTSGCLSICSLQSFF